MSCAAITADSLQAEQVGDVQSPGSNVISGRGAVMQSMQADTSMTCRNMCQEAELCRVSRWAHLTCEGLALCPCNLVGMFS